MRWKIKRFSNDDLRQKFIDATVPQGHYLGLKIPDPELKFNEATGHWESGPIDWDEFKRVLAGDGPCNRQRMRLRQQTEAEGAWVREAAQAYAEKRAARRAAARRDRRATCRSADAAVRSLHPRPRPAWRTSMSDRCMRPTTTMALQMARDVYTRRGEGVSIWVVRSNLIAASDPTDKDDDVRADGLEDLSPPHLLRSARRRREHVMTANSALRLCAAPRRHLAGARPSPVRMVRPCADAGGGYRAFQSRARSDRSGAAVL